MSATVQQFNYVGKAEGIVSALDDARSAFVEAIRLAREIADAADRVDTAPAVRRYSSGLIAEAGVLSDFIDEVFPSVKEYGYLLDQANAFKALVELATRGEADNA